MRKLLLLVAAFVAALGVTAGATLANHASAADRMPSPDHGRCDVLTDDGAAGVGVCDLVHIERLVDAPVGPPAVTVEG